MSETMRRVFEEAGGQLPLFLEFLAKAGQNPQVWQATVAPFRRYHRFFAAMIERGVAEGSLRPLDADAASYLLLAFAVGMLALGLLDPQGTDWGQLTEEGLQMLLQGLERT